MAETNSREGLSWTQPICDDCWDRKNPERPSPRTGEGARERCSYCNRVSESGIYLRDDPLTVPYPARTGVADG